MDGIALVALRLSGWITDIYMPFLFLLISRHVRVA